MKLGCDFNIFLTKDVGSEDSSGHREEVEDGDEEDLSSMLTPRISLDSDGGSAAINEKYGSESGTLDGTVGVAQSDGSLNDDAEPAPAFEEEVSDVHRSNAWGAAYDVPVPTPAAANHAAVPTDAPQPVNEANAAEPPAKKMTFAERLKAMRERSKANVAKAMETAGKP